MDLRPAFLQFPVWKTCLRSIVCFDEPRLAAVIDCATEKSLAVTVLKDLEAYRYLLETICGLKSDIIGETQVLGQFKTFLQETEKNHKLFYLNHYSLFQNLLQDCKELREKHIHHWGGSSYGSLTRKMAEGTTNICIIGNGQLARSLIPWMKQKKIHTFCRHPRNLDEQMLSIENMLQVAGTDAPANCLVIAAPVENAFLLQLLKQVNFVHIIDWRTEAALPNLAGYHSFKNLAGFMQTEKSRKQQHLDLLKVLILEKLNIWNERKLYRPRGWDDLC